MEPWEDDGPARRGVLGLWGAALFNICLVILPLAGAHAASLVERRRLYTYDPSPAAHGAARSALERLAGRMVQPGQDRREQWDARVAIELMEGDVAAARGFLLSARAMLNAEDAGRISRAARDDDRDADLEVAALDLLTPGTRARYQATVPLLSRRTSAGERRAARVYPVLGDATDFQQEAETVLRETNAPMLRLVLTGLGVSVRTQATPDALAGASAIRADLLSDQLRPAFVAELERLAQAAAPRARFAEEAARRQAAAPNDDRLATLDGAFRASIEPAALQRFAARLEQAGDIVTATSPDGARALLAHARDVEDIQRLRLLAQTNPDRAVALAKRAPRDGLLPSAARGSLAMTRELAMTLAAAAAAAVGAVFATLMTLIEAIRRALARHGVMRPRVRTHASEPEEEEPQLMRRFR